MRRASTSPRRHTPRGVPYSLAEFLDDHDRILRGLGAEPIRDRASHRALDGGRLLALDLHILNPNSRESRPQLTHPFRRKYGPALCVTRREQFVRVMQFIAKHASEIEKNGFGRFDPITEVHDVLIKHLLDFPVPSQSDAIPPSALRRFYDDWGQRWF